jgi:aldehyde dehydrogenase (NAD(P)+)
MNTLPSQASVPISNQAVNDAVAALHNSKERWANMPTRARIAYLEDIRDRIQRVAQSWVAAAVNAKGTTHAPALAGEEWMSGPWAVLRNVKQLIETLDKIASGNRKYAADLPIRVTASNQTVVQVFPRTLFDRVLLNGVRAEVWMQPGITPDTLGTQTASAYHRKHGSPSPSVGLVLGAGNISSIAPLDTLYKLFTDLSVVILKLNPVNDYLGPYIEDIFAMLIRDGFVQVVYGGAEVGAYLCNHPQIDTLHITGSSVTHDAIVFGTKKQQGTTRQRINHKPITSELGGVSPVIVVPGPWTGQDIAFQARNIATQRLHNGGFNCIAAQIVVLPGGWKKTRLLEEAIATAVTTAPDRPPYYPGTEQRKERFRQHYDNRLNSVKKPLARDQLMVSFDATETGREQPLYQEEAFAPVLGMPHIAYRDELDFLRKAIDFSNEKLAGTLGANILIHPRTLAKLGTQFEAEIARLRYGCIAVNLWTGAGFLMTETSWGAFPGHPIDDVQSGIGTVHNTLMFDHPQKSVLYGPFHPFPSGILAGRFGLMPEPPWFVSHRSAHKVAEQLFRFEANPSWLKIPGIVLHALRS